MSNRKIRSVLATLALWGWYLMLPPVYRRPPYIDPIPPRLSQWTIFGSYDSAEKCQTDLESEQKNGNRVPTTDGLDRALVQSDEAAVCIATDDPRLAK